MGKKMKIKQKRSKKVRKGDRVLVIAGNARGQQGSVIACLGDRVVVEGTNMCKKHVKPSQNHPQGGLIEMERPMHVSNVCPCDDNGTPLKLKVRTTEEGERELYYMQDGQPVVRRTLKSVKK